MPPFRTWRMPPGGEKKLSRASARRRNSPPWTDFRPSATRGNKPPTGILSLFSPIGSKKGGRFPSRVPGRRGSEPWGSCRMEAHMHVHSPDHPSTRHANRSMSTASFLSAPCRDRRTKEDASNHGLPSAPPSPRWGVSAGVHLITPKAILPQSREVEMAPLADTPSSVCLADTGACRTSMRFLSTHSRTIEDTCRRV
eukprot:scaffold241_cov340-Pavlova_lutheri.AAC.29